MYCPKCATSNNEDAKFCRKCGVNISLIPQALTGQLSQLVTTKFDQYDQHKLSRGITSCFIGLSFLITAFVLWLSRQTWGVWMLIPGFTLLGKGISNILTVSINYGHFSSHSNLSSLPHKTSELLLEKQEENFDFLQPPPSVTENTTRHFNTPSK